MMDQRHYHQRLKNDVHLYLQGWTLVAVVYEHVENDVRVHSHLFGEDARPVNHQGKVAANFLLDCEPTPEAVETLFASETDNDLRVDWLGDYGTTGYCGWDLDYFHRLVARYKRYCAYVKGAKS